MILGNVTTHPASLNLVVFDCAFQPSHGISFYFDNFTITRSYRIRGESLGSKSRHTSFGIYQ